MEKKTISLKELKKRKMLLVLPVLILPFITMLFWSLGGGRSAMASTGAEAKKGFNMELPNPAFTEDSALNKMSYYDKATLDSLKLLEQIKKDPNYAAPSAHADIISLEDAGDKALGFTGKGKTVLTIDSYKSANEREVYEKLKLLQKTISQPLEPRGRDQDMREFKNYGSSEDQSEQIKNLEQIMAQISAPSAPDPELEQLGGMLENILDIQHPARVQQRLKQVSQGQKGKIFTVNSKIKQQNISSLENAAQNQGGNSTMQKNQNSFFSVEEDSIAAPVSNALQAVVHQTQTIVNGATVKLRLSADVFINGTLIPKNSFLFGTAALKAERLEIKIDNIKYQNSIFPVQLSVYDMDGIEGVYIPGAINRDVAKASADRSIQSMGAASLDDSWGAQAAGMGIEAAKSLLSKKVKLIKVVVKAGYRVLLYDEKQKNSQ